MLYCPFAQPCDGWKTDEHLRIMDKTHKFNGINDAKFRLTVLELRRTREIGKSESTRRRYHLVAHLRQSSPFLLSLAVVVNFTRSVVNVDPAKSSSCHYSEHNFQYKFNLTFSSKFARFMIIHLLLVEALRERHHNVEWKLRQRDDGKFAA